jgi:hypothetical protein
MKRYLGPLEVDGRVPAHQQTRISAFLMSAHGAQARQLTLALPVYLRDGSQVELHAQLCREMEIVSLLAHATAWIPDPMLPLLALSWEAEWVPKPPEGVADFHQGLLIDMAALGHALHTAIRPAALLPEHAAKLDPFAMALQRIEFESGRLMQAQIVFLKSPQLLAVRDVVTLAVERRHAQVRQLWTALLQSIGIAFE